MKRCIFSAVIFSAIALVSPFVHADALDDILKAKVLKVAVPQDFPPFGSMGPDMKPSGYDIDMAKLIAQELGVAVENEAKLLERLNAVIAKAKKDGSLNQIAEKWMKIKRPATSFL